MRKFIFGTVCPAFAVATLIAFACGATWLAGTITASPGYYTAGGDKICMILYTIAAISAIAVIALVLPNISE